VLSLPLIAAPPTQKDQDGSSATDFQLDVSVSSFFSAKGLEKFPLFLPPPFSLKLFPPLFSDWEE